MKCSIHGCAEVASVGEKDIAGNVYKVLCQNHAPKFMDEDFVKLSNWEGTMPQEMDAIDKRQQKEIHILAGTVAIVGILLVIFLFIVAANREIMCVHKECPHYIVNAHE